VWTLKKIRRNKTSIWSWIIRDVQFFIWKLREWNAMLKVYHSASHIISFSSVICHVLPYLYFASCFSVIWGRRYDLLIGLTDTILALTVTLKMNAFPSSDGFSTLQVIWKVQARCIVGSQIIPVCFFMLTRWPHNSSSLRMGIAWLWSFPCF